MYSFLRKTHVILLTALAWSMTFSFDQFRVTSLLSVLVAVNALPLAILSKKNLQFQKNGALIVFALISVYLIHVLGLINSENFNQGTFELEKKLTLLIFPIALFFTPRLEAKELKRTLLFFVVSCLVTLIGCLLVAGIKWYPERDTSFFFYHQLSEIAGMHASYLGMYLCFSIFVLLYIYDDQLGQLKTWQSICFYSAIATLTLGVFMLSARTQLLILFGGIIIYVFIRLKRRWGLFRSFLGGILLGVVMVGVVLLFPVNRERLKQVINFKGEYSINGKWGEQQMRPLVWSCALELIKAKPLMGEGIGDGEDMLQECYKKNQYGSLTYFQNARFNAHNQYLEITIQLGLSGLLIFMISIFMPLQLAWRDRNYLYVVMIMIFCISCLTESMLERQNGIIFYALFNSLLFFNNTSETKSE